MSVKKLKDDARDYFRDRSEAFPDADYYTSVWGNTEFWKKAGTDPQQVPHSSIGNIVGPSAWRGYVFRNCLYAVKGAFSPEQDGLLIQDHFDSERRTFERLKRKFELAQHTESPPDREVIPEEVRIAVWRRDNGRCVRCGSRERLEYDHIIPASRGGSSTARNIELLCEICNRSKGANIQ